VAISKSGSETFVNGEAIPMMSPQEINEGSIIRLGYPGQQCVELQFGINSAEKKPERVTNVKSLSNVQVNQNDDNKPFSDFEVDSHKIEVGESNQSVENFFETIREK
jgi:hypothetical protein